MRVQGWATSTPASRWRSIRGGKKKKKKKQQAEADEAKGREGKGRQEEKGKNAKVKGNNGPDGTGDLGLAGHWPGCFGVV